MITQVLDQTHLSLVRRYLSGALVAGGRSQFKAGAKRERERVEDNIAGQLGECGGSLLLTGSTDLYVQHRESQGEDPSHSTGASDLPGYPVDFKTSRWRHFRGDIYRHHLWVRKKERHPGLFYVQAVADWSEKRPETVKVYWLGWVAEEALPDEPEEGDRFSLPCSALHVDFEELKRCLGLPYEKPTTLAVKLKEWLCRKCQGHYRRRGGDLCVFCALQEGV